jgi:hypothetical protein
MKKFVRQETRLPKSPPKKRRRLGNGDDPEQSERATSLSANIEAPGDSVLTNANTEGGEKSTDTEAATTTEGQEETDDVPMDGSSVRSSSQRTTPTRDTKTSNA